MIICAGAGAVLTAQDVPVTPPAGPGKTQPPPPMRRPGGPGGPGKPGESRFPRTGGNMSPVPMEGIERLPDEEKKRVRAAIDKAWTTPAVQEAKDRYFKANEEFRAAMRQALNEVDPEVVKILEKIKPQQPDQRSFPKLPPPTDNAFAKVALERLGMELMTFVRPENREKVRAIHVKVMQTPEVKTAVEALLAAPPEKKIEALGKLREVYRQAISKELPNLPKPQPKPTAADATVVPQAAPDQLPK